MNVKQLSEYQALKTLNYKQFFGLLRNYEKQTIVWIKPEKVRI